MSDSRKWSLIAGIAGSAVLLYLLAPILMPFAMAAILAYLGDPIVDKLEKFKYRQWHISRTIAVVLVFSTISLAVGLLLLIIVPSIEDQINFILAKLPDYVNWINQKLIPVLRRYLGREIRPLKGDYLINLIQTNWQSAGGIVEWVLGSVSHSGKILLAWLMNLVLIPVIAFYLLRDWNILLSEIKRLLPRRSVPLVEKLASEANAVLGAFMRGQFYVMLALGAIYSIGLSIAGLDVALLIGMLAGLVSFIPYMGTILGIVSACFAALLQFQEVMALLPIVIVFGAGQMLDGMFLTPLLVGDKIGLHPVAVIFAVLAGGQLFGFLGVLLALPLASIIMVLLRHVHDHYLNSDFYLREWIKR